MNPVAFSNFLLHDSIYQHDFMSAEVLSITLKTWQQQTTVRERPTPVLEAIVNYYNEALNTENIFNIRRKLNLDSSELNSLPNIFSYPPFLQLQEINLASNLLTELPRDFGLLQHLEILDLQRNQFSSFPNLLLILPRLKSLNLSFLEFTELPEEISSLENLESLFLSDNNLTNLPQNIGALKNLQELDITGNQIAMLPSSFFYLSQLRTLKVGDNEDIKLPEEIKYLQNLEVLHFEDNNKELPSSIKELNNLKKLCVSENYFIQWPHVIQHLPKKLTIILDHNDYSVQDLEKMFIMDLEPNITCSADLYKICKTTPQPLSNISSALALINCSLDLWIKNLFSKAIFLTSENEKIFSKKLLSLLEIANNTPAIYSKFTENMKPINLNSENEVTYLLVILDLMCKLEEVDITDIHRVAKFLKNTSFSIQLLEKYEINLLLYLQNLQQTLEISLSPELMLYPIFEKINESHIDRIGLEVSIIREDKMQFLNFLSENELWNKSLTLNYSISWGKLIEKKKQAEEKATTRKEAITIKENFRKDLCSLSDSIIYGNLPIEKISVFCEKIINCIEKSQYNPMLATREFVYHRKNFLKEISINFNAGGDNHLLDSLLIALTFFSKQSYLGDNDLIDFLCPTQTGETRIKSLGAYINKFGLSNSGILYIELLLSIFEEPSMQRKIIEKMHIAETLPKQSYKTFFNRLSILLEKISTDIRYSPRMRDPQTLYCSYPLLLSMLFPFLNKLEEYEKKRRPKKDPPVHDQTLQAFKSLKKSFPSFQVIETKPLSMEETIKKIKENQHKLKLLQAYKQRKRQATTDDEIEIIFESQLKQVTSNLEAWKKIPASTTPLMGKNIIKILRKETPSLQRNISQLAQQGLRILEQHGDRPRRHESTSFSLNEPIPGPSHRYQVSSGLQHLSQSQSQERILILPSVPNTPTPSFRKKNLERLTSDS